MNTKDPDANKLLTIKYAPKTGVTVPDLEVLPYAEMICASFLSGFKSVEIKVGSEILVNAFRVLIKRGRVPHNQVILAYGSRFVRPNAKDIFAAFPDGAPEVHCDLLMELV